MERDNKEITKESILKRSGVGSEEKNYISIYRDIDVVIIVQYYLCNGGPLQDSNTDIKSKSSPINPLGGLSDHHHLPWKFMFIR